MAVTAATEDMMRRLTAMSPEELVVLGRALQRTGVPMFSADQDSVTRPMRVNPGKCTFVVAAAAFVFHSPADCRSLLPTQAPR